MYLIIYLLTSHDDHYQNVCYRSFKTKNQKIQNNTKYSVPVINLSNYILLEKQQLKLGLGYCFVDKNKDVLKFLAANFGSLADSIKANIDDKNLEHFHEFLRGYRDIFANNIDAAKGYTYHNFLGMIHTKDIVVVKGDKDSSIVITKRSDYVTELGTMINDGIMKGTYIETTDSTLKELSQTQDFQYRNFYNYEGYYCKDMKPDSNQLAYFLEQLETTSFKI